MKILHVIDSGGLYGAEVMLLNLVDCQMSRGLDPTILSIGDIGVDEKPFEKEARERGYDVRPARMRRGPNFVGALKIITAAKREGFDLIHCHGYKSNILFGFMPRHLRKIPIVATVHGWTATGGFSKMRLYEWVDAVSLRFMDAVILVNKDMLNGRRTRLLQGIKFHVVNNGIRTMETSIEAKNMNDLDEGIAKFCKGGYTIGSIGRLSSEKGFNHLVLALKLVVEEQGDVRLVIIGEGYERKALEDLADRCGVRERVMLPGYRNDAKKYLPCFDVFVLPSLTEGLPITLLEAMNAEIPVVATKVGGVPEVLEQGKGGFLVDAGNAEELARCILKARKEPDLSRELCESAARTIRLKYSSEQMAAGYHEIYKTVVGA